MSTQNHHYSARPSEEQLKNEANRWRRVRVQEGSFGGASLPSGVLRREAASWAGAAVRDIKLTSFLSGQSSRIFELLSTQSAHEGSSKEV